MAKQLSSTVVILGSGPGGSIVAKTLADAGIHVLVLEKGPDIKQSEKEPYSLDEMNRQYKQKGMTVALGSPVINYVEAQTLGGGSEINAGLYHRLPKHILSQWQTDYGYSVSSAQLDACYNWCEDFLSISPSKTSAKTALKLADAAKANNWTAQKVPRWYKNDIKQSMSELVYKQSNITVITNANATKLKKKNGKWHITASHNQTILHIEATSVFVSMGAIQTPHFLKRNGINHNIGNTLACHPMIKCAVEYENDLTDDQLIGDIQVKDVSPHYSFGCSISTQPFLWMALQHYIKKDATLLSRSKNMAMFYVTAPSETNGRVLSVPGVSNPLVWQNTSNKTAQHLVDGINTLAAACLKTGAKAVYPILKGATPLTHTNQTITCKKQQLQLSTIHLFSSCPAGDTQHKTAVNSDGNVWGHPGLYIADGSVVCTPPTVNPQGTIMAMCRHIALQYIKQFKLKD